MAPGTLVTTTVRRLDVSASGIVHVDFGEFIEVRHDSDQCIRLHHRSDVQAVAHKTRTWLVSHEVRLHQKPSGRVHYRPDPFSGWSCTCGSRGFGATREEARRAARHHRETNAA